MGKKNPLKIIGIILAIALALYLINYFGGEKTLTTVPIKAFPQETFSPYSCPADVDLCKVQGKMTCNVVRGEQQVIFRTNGNWIAWDIDNNGALECFIKGTKPSTGNCNQQIMSSIVIPIGSQFFSGILFRGNPNYVFVKDKEVATNYCMNSDYVFVRSSSGCDTSTTHTGNMEIISGTTNLYSCSANFKITDKNGGTKASETLTYSSQSSAGERYSSQYDISPGETASITGTDAVKILYGTYENVDECIVNRCNGENTGYYQCLNNRVNYNNLTYCNTGIGEVCQSGVCTVPFTTKKIEFSKAGYTPNESIIIRSTFVSPKFSPADVKFIIYQGTTKISEKTISNYNFQTGSAVTTVLLNPGKLGEFYVVALIPLTTESFLGMELFDQYGNLINLDNIITIGGEQEFKFRVANPIFLILKLPYSPLTGTALFTNSPIYIDLLAKDGDGNSISPDNINLEIKFKGAVQSTPNYVTPLPEPGLYRFIIQSATPGTLDVKASIVKSGVKSNEESISSEVKDPLIITSFTNLGLIRSIEPSIQRVKFETKNSFNEYIDTTNIVKITPPGAVTGLGDIDISSTVQREDVGRYYFDYNFNQIGGYTINIYSSAVGYPVGDKPLSGIISVAPGNVPDECVESTDCGQGELCLNGSCVGGVSNYWIYILIGGIVIVGIFIIILLIKLRKKTSVDLGSY